jgi:hypothetical protein
VAERGENFGRRAAGFIDIGSPATGRGAPGRGELLHRRPLPPAEADYARPVEFSDSQVMLFVADTERAASFYCGVSL